MIHKYRLNNYNIVIDSGSGTIHVLDDLAFKILDLFDLNESFPGNLKKITEKLNPCYKGKEISEALDEIRGLIKAGALFLEDDFKDECGKIGVPLPVKALCLNISHDCNMKCSYCFASKGNYGLNRDLMSFETAKKAIDFLIEHSDNIKNLDVDFFGGEPLLNFEVVKKTVNYARRLQGKNGKKFRFTLTTNGILLDDAITDFLNKEMCNVILSFDGRKNINDQIRKTMGDQGTYDVIVPKFQKFAERRNKLGKLFYIRSTFTKKNLDFSKDFSEIYRLGFNGISFIPVVINESSEYYLKKGDLPKIFSEYEAIANEMIKLRDSGVKIDFFNFMIDLKNGPCAVKRTKGCGCGNEYLAITPGGDIFPCHQFVGNDEWTMGNVNDKTFDVEMKTKFSKININSKQKCKNCWVRFYCGGGCNANNWKFNRNMTEPYEISCEIHKKRIECAIMLKVDEFMKNSQ